MQWKRLACVAVVLATVWLMISLGCRVQDQARQIADMNRVVEQMRRDAEYWPALVRVEMLRMEVRLRTWMEDRDGAARKQDD